MFLSLRNIVGFLFIVFVGQINAWTIPLKSGDLIFFDYAKDGSADAIVEVTQQQFSSEYRMSHMGVIEIDAQGKPYIIDSSFLTGVRRISLDEFMVQSLPAIRQIWAGQWRPEWRLAAQRGLEGLVYGGLGAKYDRAYDWESDGYYCSKLLKFFRDIDTGEFLIPPIPMNFGRSGSRARRLWDQHFRSMNLPIPDGKPGLSPLSVYLVGKAKYFL